MKSNNHINVTSSKTLNTNIYKYFGSKFLCFSTNQMFQETKNCCHNKVIEKYVIKQLAL